VAATGESVELWNWRARKKTEIGQSANSVAFSPDGKVFVTGGVDHLKIWDTSGKELRNFKEHSFIGSVSFSPDGKTLATAGSFGRNVTLWNANTGQKLFELDSLINDVFAVTFSPKGDALVAAGRDGGVAVWRTTKRNDLRE
jgi:WD40 repeat protein